MERGLLAWAFVSSWFLLSGRHKNIKAVLECSASTEVGHDHSQRAILDRPCSLRRAGGSSMKESASRKDGPTELATASQKGVHRSPATRQFGWWILSRAGRSWAGSREVGLCFHQSINCQNKGNSSQVEARSVAEIP